MFLLCAATVAMLTGPPSMSAPPRDSFEIRELMRLVEHWPSGLVVCGDADRDLQPETWLLALGNGEWEDKCFEFRGDSVVDSVSIGMAWAANYALGDPDRDGRPDLLCMDASGSPPCYRLYESQDSASLPTTRVWQYAAPGGAGLFGGFFSDLDADSAGELIVTQPVRYGIEILENVGDNIYVLVDSLPRIAPGVVLSIAEAPDMDRDARPELLVGTDVGALLIFEYGPAHTMCLRDTFRTINWTLLCGLSAAPDMDRDGRPEALAVGTAPCDTGTFIVVESPADDSFEVVWSIRFASPCPIEHRIAVGDMDGDSVPEFALSGDGLRVFRCTGSDQYEQFWTGPRCGPEIGMYDLNRDGKAELICRTRLSQTVIYEYFSLGLAEQKRRRLEQVAVEPAVVAGGKEVRVRMEEGGTGAAEVHVLDVAGRMVAVVPLGRTGCATWPTRGVAPGAYFIRISSSSLSVTRKVLVVE
ncbi:T9SS type A sorting domain-containing protein [candidate division WOR-3 bacterium]|nr:T9SS type A sorting domain-containing protein [candidate division WOR-3 bacterium]